MILLVDNYDSFSYNLYQLAGAIDPDILVLRNDACPPETVERLAPRRIILSPGPGRPEQAGFCIDLVRAFGGKIPILGVCLGHQAIVTAYGGRVGYAKRLMHGKQSVVSLDPDCPLFAGLAPSVKAARYHSLAADQATLPAALRVTARADDGEIMAVSHCKDAVYGVQFHPESILTPQGGRMLQNFLKA